MNLRIEDSRGQCYDGATSMKGANTGVATQFKSLNGKKLYVQSSRERVKVELDLSN